MELFLLILGLGGLWGGSEMTIRGAMNLAEHYNLSHMFVGVTILAIGTDVPEIFIAIDASIEKSVHGIETSGIIIGNALGSSLSQITLALGIAGISGALTFERKHLYSDGFMILLSIVVVFVLGFDGALTRKEGILMIVIYLIYYIRLFQQERAVKKTRGNEHPNLLRNITLLVAGLVIVGIASNLTVDNSIVLAEKLGVKQSLVGVLFIGIGTSLPEIALGIGAIRKKAYSLSVGNLIGSNIFDLLMPVGIGATIAELEFERDLIFIDIPIIMVVTFMALFFFYKEKGLTRWEAVILLLCYFVYAFLKIYGLL